MTTRFPALNLDSAQWKDAAAVTRPFVRHRHPAASTASFWQVHRTTTVRPIVTAIIPTIGGPDREGLLRVLLGQLEAQTLSELEVVVVRGDTRQGRAINIAAALAQGTYIVTLDDDTSLVERHSLERLVDVMEKHPDIGMAGGNNAIPPDASSFVRRAMREIPRRGWEPVKEVTESDLAQHGCLMMRTQEFRAVGGENEIIPRGLDPYLREEYRKTGKRIVLVPGVVYHHLPPSNLAALVRQFYKNGREAAFANRTCPQWIIETPASHGDFRKTVPLVARIGRFPLRLLTALVSGRFLWFSAEASYAAGFCREWLFPRAQ